ncbi:CRP-like cAMP-binding protein [Pedobacter sp. AK017]|uniref:Crp/Fnr family transcriptional regulator n=1 Tax=Pedobacter sp. AK017 TaxID=2723073 RepID=UPI001616DDF3|nr:Crp/Fnr family transcriptional regulator [Pedobacter sp. AK017]MBB5440613.1 CRP-like cAMP-binding protein [Pedobacter sp. AK017]
MISDESFNILITRMSRFRPIDPEFILKLRPLLRELRVKRGELIIPKGVVPTFVPFVISGSAREVMIHPSTMQEETTWMWFMYDFIYTNPGFFSEEPTECHIEAMEDGVLVYIERADFLEFVKDFPLAYKLSEMIRDYYLKLLKKYAFDLAALSNQQRYDQFIAAHPKALATLNHKHIASFIGIRDKGLDRYSGRK